MSIISLLINKNNKKNLQTLPWADKSTWFVIGVYGLSGTFRELLFAWN